MTPARRFKLAGTIILVVGLIAAAVVYLSASSAAVPNGSRYEIFGDQAFAVAAADDSRELQQIERLGGKAAVLTFQFHLWFLSLWQGRQLALTLAILAALLALACFRIAALIEEAPDD